MHLDRLIQTLPADYSLWLGIGFFIEVDNNYSRLVIRDWKKPQLDNLSEGAPIVAWIIVATGLAEEGVRLALVASLTISPALELA